MKNEVAQQKTFEQRMIDRMKESAADLLTDDDMKKIVEKGIHQMFFTEQRDPNSSNFNTKYLKPLAIKMISDEVKEQFESQVKQWVINNEDQLMGIVKEMFEDQLTHTLMTAFTNMFSSSFMNLKFDIENEIMNRVQS